MWRYDISHCGQLLTLVGMFPSVSEARRSGINGVLKPGDYWFKRRTIHIFVEDE